MIWVGCGLLAAALAFSSRIDGETVPALVGLGVWIWGEFMLGFGRFWSRSSDLGRGQWLHPPSAVFGLVERGLHLRSAVVADRIWGCLRVGFWAGAMAAPALGGLWLG